MLELCCMEELPLWSAVVGEEEANSAANVELSYWTKDWVE